MPIAQSCLGFFAFLFSQSLGKGCAPCSEGVRLLDELNTRGWMRPRFAADYRTLTWVLLTSMLAAAQYRWPAMLPYAWPLSCYFALACGVIAHNHNHCPTFSNKTVNRVFANWISIFYGYPTFAWIPTHNMNHHKYVNRAGDATITWRYSTKHNLVVAATYFFVSSYWQTEPIRAFIRKAKERNPALYRTILMQYATFATVHAALLTFAIWLHGFVPGIAVYLMVFVVPAFFALWTVMLFNYEQHVHTDPWSEHNHSRSWDGRLVNFLLFNNGLHAAHHEKPGLHWSQLRAVHEKLAPHIDPQLVHRGMWPYFIRQYLLAPFFPALGTRQVGRPPYDPPDGVIRSLATADIDIGEAGANAEMVRG
jgi:beta-carotene hydroxylase